MKIIGAGFGRTGTSSLKVALEELGFGPCYHMSEIFAHPEHFPLWEKAALGEPVDWAELFANYNATVDWPASAFYEDIRAVYPDAKVVLTIRDGSRWYESARSLHTVSARALRPGLVSAILDMVVPVQQRAIRLVDAVVWRGIFHGQFKDKTQALAIFDQHIEDVANRVPHDHLLIYDVKEGWAPLCTFLGLDIPDGKPFPHLHDSGAVRKIVQRQVIRTIFRLVTALISIPVGALERKLLPARSAAKR